MPEHQNKGTGISGLERIHANHVKVCVASQGVSKEHALQLDWKQRHQSVMVYSTIIVHCTVYEEGDTNLSVNRCHGVGTGILLQVLR
jgi:hypothetical protein